LIIFCFIFKSKFIGAGSDDGSFYIWDRKTSNILRIFKADESIVNCIQPNPYTSMIATSGIGPNIRIWTPVKKNNFLQKFVLKKKKFSTIFFHNLKGTERESRIVDDIKSNYD
jgi:WD40 repeat protein